MKTLQPIKILICLSVCIAIICPQTQTNKPSTKTAQCLAPHIASVPRVFGTQEATDEDFEGYISAILERGQKPVVIFDKNGTVTPHKKAIDTKMAERIVKLAAAGCQVFLLTTNNMSKIKTQFTDILLYGALPKINEQRTKEGKRRLDKSVMENITICPMSGAELWQFDTQDNTYVQDFNQYVNTAYFKQVLATTDILRKIMLDHPLYAIPKTSSTRNLKKQVTLSSMKTQDTPLELKKAFNAADMDFKDTFGRSKREVWRATLKELFNIYDANYQQDMARLLNKYIQICNSKRGGKSARFAKVMEKESFSKFRDMTVTDILFDMLEIRDGVCHALRTARRRKNKLANTLGRIAPEETEQRAKIKTLLDYWTKTVNDIENQSQEGRERHLTAIKEMAVLIGSYTTSPAHPHQEIFIEIGGDTSVDIKFSNKGTALDHIIRAFKIQGTNIIYFGDEFMPHRGDSSTITSGAGMLVNVGRPIDLSQVPASSTRTLMFTQPFAGVKATGQCFDLILETIQEHSLNSLQSAA